MIWGWIFLGFIFLVMAAIIQGAAPMNRYDPIDNSNIPDEYKDL